MREAVQIQLQAGVSMEYTWEGQGTPILVLHGGHSSCQESFGYKELIEQGYAILTPSRAGYGGTSREAGTSLAAACRSYIALLDHLNLDKVHVIAISAGGPSGIYMAAHYPERVSSLTLQSAVTKEWLTPEHKEYKAAKVIFRPGMEKVTWTMMGVLCNLFPTFLLKQMAPSFSKLSYEQVRAYNNADDVQAFKQMMQRQRSGHGFMIDLELPGQLSASDLRAIVCPTFIMHSRHDSSVPIAHAQYAHEQIAQSQLCELDTWGHLIWLGKGSEQVHRELGAFLANV